MDEAQRALILHIEQRLDDPSAKGLAVAVGRAVRDGALSPGNRLPPIRALAHELALSPTTVSASWTLLVRAGTLRTDGRRGTVVADTSAPRAGRYSQAVEHHMRFDLDLSTGVPDERLLPGLSRALRAVPTAGTPRSYLEDPVLPELRELLLSDWPYPPPAMAVVDGAMDGLELVIRTLLRFGDRVVVEHPTFPPLLDLLEAAGVEAVGVPLDAEGLRPDILIQALATPSQAVFLQPRSHNPTGISLSHPRRDDLVRALSNCDAVIVEDDSTSSISTTEDLSLGTELADRTVHLRSYSKSHGPDLRLAAMGGPSDLIGEVRRRRQLGQGWSSRLLQRVLHNLLTDERSQAEVQHARDEYARRRAEFTAALAHEGIEVAGSDGLNVWVPVADEAAALMRLAARGIGAAPGAPFNVLTDTTEHVRVTTGLIHRGAGITPTQVAVEVATAARTGGWGNRAR